MNRLTEQFYERACEILVESLLEGTGKRKLKAAIAAGRVGGAQGERALATYGGWSAPRDFIRDEKGNPDHGGRVRHARNARKKKGGRANPEIKASARSGMPLERTPGEEAHIKGKPYTSNPRILRKKKKKK